MDYLLHVDTSTDVAHYALAKEGIVVAATASTVAKDHAATINLQVQHLLDEVGISLQQLSAIAVCAGPGSYTGLRIGMASAKGYCYALDIPMLAHNKLELIARQFINVHGETYEKYVCVRYAREKEYFVCVLTPTGDIVQEATHMTEENLTIMLNSVNNCIIITDRAFPAHLQYAENNYVEVNEAIDMKAWAQWAMTEYRCKKTVNLSTAEPFYLKQVYTHK